MNKKGQTAGLVTALVFGVATLIIGVIIAFVLVDTMVNAELLTSTRTSSATVNESDNNVAGMVFINATGYTLKNYDSDKTAVITINKVFADINQSKIQQGNLTEIPGGYNLSLSSGNYSISSSGIVTNISGWAFPNVSISYTITTKSTEEQATEKLDSNFTNGINNVSSKIPTVLLVGAIVLILSVLALLVGVWARMRMGGGSTL